MSFVLVTIPMLYTLTDEVKLKFAKSKQPKRIKDVAREIFPVYRLLWQPRSSYRARAWACNIKYLSKIEKQMHLSKRIHPYTRIGFGNYFMCVDVNLSGAKGTTRKALKNLVSHEFAHLIEIAFKKTVNEKGSLDYPSDTGHDAFWQELHKAMGGDAKLNCGF